MVFHVLNRGVGRRLLFTKDEDFLAFERVVVQIWWLSPFLSQALEAAPGFIEARRYRAVVLARQGEWERATRDINWCLDREPGSGETLYAAACVAARAAEASPTPGAVDRAFDLLQRALSLGSGHRAAEDPDLTALRRDPRFKRLITTTSGPNDGNGSGVRPTVNSGRDSGRQSQRENEHVSSL